MYTNCAQRKRKITSALKIDDTVTHKVAHKINEMLIVYFMRSIIIIIIIYYAEAAQHTKKT